MKEFYEITDVEQLKALSDPLRMNIIWGVGEQAKTGKMLADELNLPASKVHYHLKELEKAGIIQVERTEEKNGIMQKFYRLIAKRIIVDSKLLPQVEDIHESLKTNMILSLERTQSIINRTEERHLLREKQDTEVTFNMFDDLVLTEEQVARLREKLSELSKLVGVFKEENKGKRIEGQPHHMNIIILPTGQQE